MASGRSPLALDGMRLQKKPRQKEKLRAYGSSSLHLGQRVPAKTGEDAAPLPAQVTHLQLLGKGPMLRARIKSHSRETGTTHRSIDLNLDAAGQLLEQI